MPKHLSEIDMTGNKIVNLGSPSSDSDAATKGWAKDRANHTGTQTASSISDFNTAVQANKLNQLASPDADVSLNNYKLTNVANGTASKDAVNKSQLDAALQGVTSKRIARVTTTTTLPDCTYANGSSGVGATLTGNDNGAITSIDGATLVQGDALLVRNQSNQYENGLYVVSQLGDAGTPFILTRDVSMDTTNEMAAMVAVREGATLSNSLWLSSANTGFVIGTDNLTFVQVNASTSMTAGDGIEIVGNEISVSYGDGLTVDSGDVVIDAAVVVQKYSETIGNGSDASIVVTHGLGTRDVQVQVRRVASPYDQVIVDNEATTTSTVTLKFGVAPSSNEYRVTIQG